VLALDLRGRGESDQPNDAYSLADHAGDVLGFLDALGFDPLSSAATRSADCSRIISRPTTPTGSAAVSSSMRVSRFRQALKARSQTDFAVVSSSDQ